MMSYKLSKAICASVASASKIPGVLWRSASTIERNHEVPGQTTVDTLDVELFSNQMKDWWQLDGPMQLLHKFNTLRVPFVRDGLVQCSLEHRELYPLKNKKVLDVGCGGGILSEGLARIGAQVTGVDASPELISVAKEHSNMNPKLADNKPNYLCTTIEEHAKQRMNYYDGIVASEVIEHVNNPEFFVKSCVETLKPGGRIFFTTPSKTRLAQFLIIFLCENVIRSIPKGAHQYEKFLTPTELTFMLEKNNCQVESTFGIQFNPLTRKWDFSNHQQLMFAIQAQKLS